VCSAMCCPVCSAMCCPVRCVVALRNVRVNSEEQQSECTRCFLCAFAKLRKAAMSFVICLSDGF
jgi:hypothetical protein